MLTPLAATRDGLLTAALASAAMGGQAMQPWKSYGAVSAWGFLGDELAVGPLPRLHFVTHLSGVGVDRNDPVPQRILEPV